MPLFPCKGDRSTHESDRSGMKMKTFLQRASNLDLWIASFALAVLIILTICGVLMRYIFNNPLTWLEEVQLFCMVWIVFTSGGAAFRTKSHVAIEMVVDTFPKSVQKYVEYAIDAIVLFSLGYLFLRSVGYVQLFLRSGRTTSMLGIPYWFIYGIVPFACIDMVVSYIHAKYFVQSPALEENR